MNTTKNILVLCTRNSARSQMAEGILRKHAGDRFNIYSAGLNPGPIDPMAEFVMREVSIDISGHRSKSVQEYLGKITAHYLIVVCETAERDCPKMFPGPGQRLYWPIDDPVAVEGSQERRLEAFRRARDAISERVLDWLSELVGTEEGHGFAQFSQS